MGLRDEINSVKKASAEYEQEQRDIKEKEYRDKIESNGRMLIEKLKIQLKLDASRGKVSGNKLSGTLRFASSWSLETDEQLRGKGYMLSPNVEEKYVHRGLGIFVNEWVYKITVTPTNEILDAFNVLKKYAEEEHISLGDLYVIDSDGVAYYKRKVTVTEKRSTKKFNYAVDYSILL